MGIQSGPVKSRMPLKIHAKTRVSLKGFAASSVAAAEQIVALLLLEICGAVRAW
jgi:hypothetical protein